MNIEKTIKRQVARQWMGYILFWLLTAMFALAYEFDFLTEGLWVGQTQKEYVGETVSVLLTMALIPLALKLFPLLLPRYAKGSVEERLRAYGRLFLVRLLLLAVSAWLNLWVYYATLDNIGGLCALITMTASVFCMPGEQKLKDDLLLVESDK